MPGWGAAVNKGPLNEQQVTNLVDYLESIQLTPEEAQREAQVGAGHPARPRRRGRRRDDEVDAAIDDIDYDDPAVGQALFNLETAGAGAYACARCHTRGWSIIQTGEDAISPPDAPIEGVYVGFPDGSGAFGPNLTGGLIPRQFANYEELIGFISPAASNGEPYGNNGIGSGRMPGFGDNPNTEEVEGDGMMTPEMIAAIARYEATLPGVRAPRTRRARRRSRDPGPARSRRGGLTCTSSPPWRASPGTPRSAASSRCSWASWS